MRAHRVRLCAALCAAVLTGALLAACGSPSTSTTGTVPSSSTAAAPTTTLPPPLDPAAYQQILTSLNGKLTTDLQQVGAARNPAAIRAALSTTENDVTASTTQLAATVPPPPLAAGQQALVSALRDFGTDLTDADSLASDGTLCGGSSALARLSRSNGANEVRAAAAQLASGAAQVGSFLPAVTQDADRQLGNGTILTRSGSRGLGELTIDNGGSTDAVVGLVVSGNDSATLSVYVRNGESTTLSGIHDATYGVYVSSGNDWDNAVHQFTRNCDYQRFDDPMEFTTTDSEYTTYDITLTPVIGGNATESGVDPNAFPAM